MQALSGIRRSRTISIRLSLERAADLITRGVARYWGEQFPFYYVMEFPKSGGSWLSNMIADYLQIPRPSMPVFPIGCTAVLHGHWRYSPRYRRVFYLYRDGRDVMVSLYFRVVHEMFRDPPYSSSPARYAHLFPVLAEPATDPDDIRSNLPRFIAESAKHSPGTRHNWSQHIDDWIDRPRIVAVSYEELLSNTYETLARVIPIHSGEPVKADRLAATVHKYCFEQQTGRTSGIEERGAIIRKGVAGDWINHFTREAGAVFDHHFGAQLVRLGYEPDRHWYEKLPES